MKPFRHRVFRTLHLLLFCLVIHQVATAQLHTDFTASPGSGCAPVFVHFTDASTGGATSWKWDLGNGTTSFLQNPSTTYFNAGTYNIKLVIKKGTLADSIVKVNFITINALPKPLFIASDTTGCYPLKVSFTDQSIAQEGGIVKWEWDFGDGTLSGLQNPLHTYSGPGNYNVILRVTNTAGCVSTISKLQYIKIKDGVVADYSFTGSSQCTPPSIVHFTNKSTGTGTLSYQWIFGDGNTSLLQDPSNIYNTAGLYTIHLIAKNSAGCIDTLTKTNSIAVGVAHANFTAPDSICQNTVIRFSNTSQPAAGSVHWNFGDNTSSDIDNPSVTYKDAGTYNVSLVADFGSCKDSVSKSIKVLSKAVADFTADKTVYCNAPFNVNFTNHSTGAVSYKWFFGDSATSTLPNPSHTYRNNGLYNVTLITINANGCADTLKKNEYINVTPAEIKIAGLPVIGCAPLAFTPSYSVKYVLPVVSFLWNFGDGTSSTDKFPTHIYTNPGSYTVTLIYTTSDGCSNMISYPNAVKAGQKPVAAFSANPTNTCASTPVGFTDHSTGNITDYLWSFGDGITDTSRNPNHFYNDTGYFSVSLVVSNNGCSDTLLKPNFIYIRPPVAKFAVDVQCNDPFHYAFTNYSVGANSLTWDFGDGTNTSDPNPVHIYSTTGNYVVKLTVTNGTCVHSASYGARVLNEKANFMASDTVVCKGDSVVLTPFGFNRNNVVAYKWSADSRTDTSAVFKVAYPKSGQYSIRLIIINSSGCSDTMMKTKYITVYGPTADFNGVKNSACLKNGGAVQLTDLSTTDNTHAIKKWQWNFGDGTSGTYTAGPFAHTYTTAGFFTVTLKTTDSEGCTDTIGKPNQIFIGDPKSLFSSNDTLSCRNKPITFNNYSTGQSLQYSWGFGDGAIASDQYPVHNFSDTGVYHAWLKVTDAYGCTDSAFKPNYIHIDDPKALFKMSDSASTCPPLVVTFTNQSKFYKQLSWDFGDGTKALVDNPVHYYTYPGIYYPKLIVTSPGGCTDTIFKKIEIKGPTGTFIYDKTSSCNPGTIGFTAQTQNTKSFIWDFNDGGTNNTTDSVTSHSYTSLGFYIPRMILEDSKGCKVPVLGKDTIHIYGVSAMFGKDKNLLCDQGAINFTDSSFSNDVITDYQWILGDGSLSAERNPVHSYTATGFYKVKLIVTTLNGCTDTSAMAAPIKVVKSPKVSMRGDSSACVPATLKFSGDVNVADTSAITWKWDFSNTITSASQNPPAVVYQQEGTFNAIMSVTNSSGCISTVVKPIVIHPVPVVNAGNNTAICERKTATLEATGADKYNWSPAKWLSCANCSTPVAAPDSTIIYKVNGESIFGCKAVDSVIITVKHPFRMQIGTGDTLCKGESFHLQANNADEYEWTPSLGLDNSHSKTPVAHPQQTTEYQVIGRDNAGCYYDTGSVKLIVYSFPTVDAGADKTMAVGSSIELNAKISSDATVIKWQPSVGLSCANCANPVANPKQTTAYTVMAMNQGGCLSRDEITVFVVCNNGNIFLPNTFSPNGNGTNDVFYPRGTGLYSIRSMRIFNRWGEPVYEATNFKANDPSKGWNGMYKNRPAPNDVYVYFVEVICENNAVLMYSGNIAVIR